jgi:hypothetical protein
MIYWLKLIHKSALIIRDIKRYSLVRFLYGIILYNDNAWILSAKRKCDFWIYVFVTEFSIKCCLISFVKVL